MCLSAYVEYYIAFIITARGVAKCIEIDLSVMFVSFDLDFVATIYF